MDAKELVLEADEKMSYGFNLYFEGEKNLIIHNRPYPEDKNELLFKNEVPKDLTEKQLYNKA